MGKTLPMSETRADPLYPSVLGIGDTRGPDQDRQNMINILRVLRNYEKLHGILILLKPNNARLTIMFKFCVKELLIHLQRNAA